MRWSIGSADRRRGRLAPYRFNRGREARAFRLDKTSNNPERRRLTVTLHFFKTIRQLGKGRAEK